MSDKPAAKGAPGTAWNDPRVPGLRLRYGATKNTWALFYRSKAGKQRNMKLGDDRVFTLTAARERAREVLAAVAKGEDPAGLRQELQNRPTMAMLRDWHLERHAETKNKAKWRDEVRSLYRLHILPTLGEDTAVADVSEADIEALHFKLRKTPYQANRVASVLHKAFKLAEGWGWRPRHSNPVAVERYKEHKRKRKPDAAEAVRLLIALNAMREESPWFVGLVELLCFTGARLNEIMAARWEWVQEDGLHLPDSKTGEKVVLLSSFARDVLASIPRVKGNPYIIVGRLKGRHLVNVSKPWARLMKGASVTVRLVRHDLRRFFASAGLSSGLDLSRVGDLLGHMDPATTKRYAYLLTDAGLESAEQAASAVHSMMTGGGKVIPGPKPAPGRTISVAAERRTA